MKQIIFASFLLLAPAASHAQDTIPDLILDFTDFAYDILLPLLITLAFLFFVINIVRYFILGASEEEGRKSARQLAVYGLAAFVLIFVFWGIVAMIVNSFGWDDCPPVQNDYEYRNNISPC